MEKFNKLASLILSSQIQVHVYHLQTKSYAEHKALEGFYSEIGDLADALIEAYQGIYGIIEEYASYKITSYKSLAETLKYFTELRSQVEELRKSVQDKSNLQNEIDTIVTLIDSTVYKLKFLS
jgi:DNA-binding ferritin-like protein